LIRKLSVKWLKNKGIRGIGFMSCSRKKLIDIL